MLNVVDDRLVVDSKGIYSIENYLTSRRLMYWQVYLHKTTVASEKVLVNVLLRAKYLTQTGVNLFASPALRYFLCRHVDAGMFHTDPDVLRHYSQLDDNDIYSAIKEWRKSDDTVLRILSENIVERRPFRVEISETPFSEERLAQVDEEIRQHVPVSEADVKYLYSVSEIQKDMYDVNDDHITILYKNGSMKDIADASEILNVALLSKKIRKYYLCYQRF